MKSILKQFKPGNKNYEVLKTLLQNKNRYVSYRALILAAELNPVRRRLIDNPEGLAKERDKLAQTIAKLRPLIQGYKITMNRKKRGYVIKTGE